MTGHKYSVHLTMAEWRIATSEEIDIEQFLWESAEPNSELERRELASAREALRSIDLLKTTGRYNDERSRLKKALDEDDAAAAEEFRKANPSLILRSEGVPSRSSIGALANLFAGMDSPDRDQQARFQAHYDATGIASETLAKAMPKIAALEPAKRRRGRSKVSPPWRNVNLHLDAIRLAVAGGSSVAQAARQVAAQEAFIRADWANDLAKLYRKKLKLRE
ncbi:hypothetical protein [Tropicimonas sediminicola]|uniref:Uncharacterized protein n=1 Tax=Tropicimonas sediminicola TaxID=1031541 RepID=A0A239M4H1_9RHOB|nr:hypothetical protein [Tropicimonas sediminicola]SNT37511.1 hypothetical protein SAMN05421757_11320 [Tropicimonas sediminicola]